MVKAARSMCGLKGGEEWRRHSLTSACDRGAVLRQASGLETAAATAAGSRRAARLSADGWLEAAVEMAAVAMVAESSTGVAIEYARTAIE